MTKCLLLLCAEAPKGNLPKAFAEDTFIVAESIQFVAAGLAYGLSKCSSAVVGGANRCCPVSALRSGRAEMLGGHCLCRTGREIMA